MNTIDGYLEWKDWRQEDFGRFSAENDKYFSHELNTVLDPSVPPRVLELGYGNGNFLGWIRTRALECHGVEIDTELRERAKSVLTGVYASVHDDALNPLLGSFDLVVAFDVLEHIPSDMLLTVLCRVRDLLKPGGFFLARFPNGDSPFGRVFQHGDLTHVTTIGRYMASQLASASGMRLQTVRSPAFPLNLHGMRAWPKRLLIRSVHVLMERLTSFLFYGGQRVALDQNLVAIWTKAAEKQLPNQPQRRHHGDA
jgi:SAM-dependent methyltransferase